jgi:hypothetical protein
MLTLILSKRPRNRTRVLYMLDDQTQRLFELSGQPT